MHNGSLYDLIHNETMVVDGEQMLPILRDITSGMRFLHGSGTLHGDLKATNVLVDNKFRAKGASSTVFMLESPSFGSHHCCL